MDNEVLEVYYNDRPLYVFTQNLKAWTHKKTISFEPEGDGYGQLKIKGVDYNSGGSGEDHCTITWGGLVLNCESRDGQGPWHNFKSDTRHWKSLDNHALCASDGVMVSDRHLGQAHDHFLAYLDAGAVKIWTNQKENTLIGSPLPVRK